MLSFSSVVGVSSRSLIISALTVLSLAGCKHDRSINQIASVLRQRTLPDGCSATEPAPEIRKNLTVSMGWDLYCPPNQTDFNSWVVQRLEPDFKLTVETRGLFSFSKYLPGEMQQLEIRVEGNTGGTFKAHVQFIVRPD